MRKYYSKGQYEDKVTKRFAWLPVKLSIGIFIWLKNYYHHTGHRIDKFTIEQDGSWSGEKCPQLKNLNPKPTHS